VKAKRVAVLRPSPRTTSLKSYSGHGGNTPGNSGSRLYPEVTERNPSDWQHHFCGLSYSPPVA